YRMSPSSGLVYTTTSGEASNKKKGSIFAIAALYLLRAVSSAEANHCFAFFAPPASMYFANSSMLSAAIADFILSMVNSIWLTRAARPPGASNRTPVRNSWLRLQTFSSALHEEEVVLPAPIVQYREILCVARFTVSAAQYFGSLF